MTDVHNGGHRVEIVLLLVARCGVDRPRGPRVGAGMGSAVKCNLVMQCP